VKRILEPELMTDEAQAVAYARADFAEVNQTFVDRFVRAFPEAAAGALLDLGCGPADIPIRLGRSLLRARVTAVDGSQAMIVLAAEAVRRAEMDDRIRLLCQRLPGLDLPPRSFDAVLSNSLLHHIPDPSVFWAEVRRLGRPGAALLVMDLFRPASRERARQIVEEAAADEAAVLKEDFFNSLCAAFTLEEVRAQLRAAGLEALTAEIVSERHLAVWGRLPAGPD
jgi:ubiquinone/menaquinone biosynthesis C-methylase UbiE